MTLYLVLAVDYDTIDYNFFEVPMATIPIFIYNITY